MRFVLFTYPDPAYATRWDSMSEEERAESLTEHVAWFAKYGDWITAGPHTPSGACGLSIGLGARVDRQAFRQARRR